MLLCCKSNWTAAGHVCVPGIADLIEVAVTAEWRYMLLRHSQCVCSKQSEENESWAEEPPIVFNKNRASKFDGSSIKLTVLPLVRKSSVNIS